MLLTCDHSRTRQLLLPLLWAIRNAVHDNDGNKTRVGDAGGVEVLVGLCVGTGHVLEAALTGLVNLCLGHERNCRRLLARGLDALLDLAEGSGQDVDPGSAWDEGLHPEEAKAASQRRIGALSDSRSTNKALAASLLQMVGPYSWLECRNCHAKNHGGSTCANCGHILSP